MKRFGKADWLILLIALLALGIIIGVLVQNFFGID